MTYPNLRAAVAGTGYPEAWVKAALAGGVGRDASGRLHHDPIVEWVEAHPKELPTGNSLPLKDQKLAEEIRKLRLANDAKSGKLVEVAWVNERFQRLGGEVNAIRVRSEAEDAVKFAETGGEVDRCRTVLRGIWDGLMLQFQACGKHFEE